MSLFAELKRRNVIRMAGLYLVGAWLLVQVASTALPALDVPGWVLRALIIALAFGFIPALLFSWMFEITPSGLKRDADVTPEESFAPQRAKRIDRVILVLLALSLIYFGTDRFLLVPQRDAAAGATTIQPAPQVATTSAETDRRKSIAVLPFENLSSDKDNAYFAVGMQDEILVRLSKIGALKVISRTSMQRYAAKPENLDEIANQLGVANIVEGSVQKVGNTVRINVRLISAATNQHIWAQTYDRKLDDVFSVESEVARSIAMQLNATLSGAETAQLNTPPTANADAYDAYLRGISFAFRPDGFLPNTNAAIESLEKAVQLDPNFTLAWALLSREHAFAYWVFDPSAIHKEGADKALEQARRLAPDAPETMSAHGFNRYWLERDYAGAKAIFERLRARWPNDGQATYALAVIARREGRWDESVALFAQANTIDPRNLQSLNEAAFTLVAMRKLPAAQRVLDRARDVAHDDPGVLAVQVLALQQVGDIEGAQKILDSVRIDQGNEQLVNPYVVNAIFRRNYAPAIALLESQLKNPESLGTSLGNYESSLGDLHRHAGDAAAAQAAYQRAFVAYQAAQRNDPDFANFEISLALVETGLGHRDEALRRARRAMALMPASRDALIGPSIEDGLARVQARFGDEDAAFVLLQRLIDLPYEGSPPITPATLRLDPDWDNLRDDPRFAQLIATGEQAMQARATP
ncbi:MAG: tetratricopeptide repeat protein [Dokdonella sp.]